MSSGFNLPGVQAFVFASIPEFFLSTISAKFQWARETFHADSIQQRTNRIVVGILILAAIVTIGVFRWRASSQPKANPFLNRGSDGSRTELPKENDANPTSPVSESGSSATSPLPDLSLNSTAKGRDDKQKPFDLDDVDLSGPLHINQIQQSSGSSQGSSSSIAAAADNSIGDHSENLDLPASDPSLLAPLNHQQIDPTPSEEDQHLVVIPGVPQPTLPGPGESESDEQASFNDDDDPLEGLRPSEEDMPSSPPSWWDRGTWLLNGVKSNLWHYVGHGGQE